MQNALYFENSHVRPVSILIRVKKKIPATDNHKKIYIMHRFYIGKKYLPCWSVGKKIFPRGNLPNRPPPPQKSNGSSLTGLDEAFLTICQKIVLKTSVRH